MSAPPKHAFELEIKIGAESKERLLHELSRYVYIVTDRDEEISITSGGAGAASHCELRLRDVTPGQYEAELDTWIKERRAGT